MRINADVRARLLAESVCVLFMGAVVAAANGFHLAYIIFPELAALAGDVLQRPTGKWAKEPWKLVVTPAATATAGVAVTNLLPYSDVSVFLAMILSIGIVLGLRSAVAPAISAGVLPVALGFTSWLYPVCILGGLLTLGGSLLVWRGSAFGRTLSQDGGPDTWVTEVLESTPHGKWWFLAHFLFVALIGLVAQLTGWRFILFPPLIVMAYEMLGHPGTCPWAKAPYTFPVVCTMTAAAGVQSVLWIGVTPLSAAIVVVIGFVALRVFRLRMPPALAIGLIPFILATPSYKYVLSVAIGTVALTTWFLLFRGLLFSWRTRWQRKGTEQVASRM